MQMKKSRQWFRQKVKLCPSAAKSFRQRPRFIKLCFRFSSGQAQINIIFLNEQGMVEKWLSQVESLMLQSMREICIEAVSAYVGSIRQEWVLAWPGQIVICGSTIHWTAEVSEAIEGGKLEVNNFYKLEKSLLFFV